MCIRDSIYAVCAQDCNSFSGHQRIRVSRTHDHPANARVQNRIHTRRLLSVMEARLQCDIQGRSMRIFGAGCQRIALRMSVAVSLVPALSDDPALFYDHGTHHRVGSCLLYTSQTQKCGSYVVKIQRSCRFLFRIEILC